MTSTEPAEYPPGWEADVVVSDGGTLHLRPLTPADADALVAFHSQLSVRTRYLRYFSAYPTIPQRDLIRFTHVDHVDRVALAAWLGPRIVAVGRFDRLPGADPVIPGRSAEVAFVVADAHQGRGIGSVLLEHLAEIGRELGIARFEALVLAENATMLRVFLDAGYSPSRQVEGSEVSLEFDIAATELTEKVMRERELRAESSSIRRLLYPRSVAVIGASADPGKLGHLVVRNLQRSGFTGPIYPVNPRARSVSGAPAYPDIAEVPGEVDLAVLAVPAAEVAGVVGQCGARGVRGLVVMSGGFGESGSPEARAAGARAQRELVLAARAYGMRVVGPNCLGLINTDPAVSLNASLAPVAPPAGRAGFFSQSGALGVAVLAEAARRGLGVSSFVSAGNRADVSGNDLLQYWESDPATEIALLYLESFGNPRKFARIARRFARRKPIVAVKSGRGSMAAGLQHTSVEVPEASVQALFEASGVIRTETLAQLFDVALLLSTQPLPEGDRVAVVGHSTALGMLVLDALAGSGIPLARLVDVGATASPEDFGAAVAEALAAPDVDAVVTIFVPPVHHGQESAVAEQLRKAVAGQRKPVLSTFLGFDGVPAELAVPGPLAPVRGSIPSYSSPESAVTALARVIRYARWQRRDPGQLPQLSGVNAAGARELVAGVLADAPAGRLLSATEARDLLAGYGIEPVAAERVSDVTAAVRAADRLGWPVALKAPGGVRLHLRDRQDLEEAWLSLGIPDGLDSPGADFSDADSPGADSPGAGSPGADSPLTVVQRMAPRGVDTVLQVHDDRSFGSLMSFGVGGLATELLNDRAYAVVPLAPLDAADLIAGPRAFPLLTGYGGGEPADLEALTEVVLRLSRLADDLPEVVECLLEPVVAAAGGAFVLDARIRIAPPITRNDIGARRLRGV